MSDHQILDQVHDNHTETNTLALLLISPLPSTKNDEPME